MFTFFDRKGDGLIDFEEFVLGLDIVERGNLDEKCDYCYKMYDLFGTGALDIFTLREVLNRSYSRHFIGLEKAIQALKTKESNIGGSGAWTYTPFKQLILPLLKDHLPIALDRMDFHKRLLNEAECRFNFTLDKVEVIWNHFKPKLISSFQASNDLLNHKLV
jgi:hypothetical protein